MTILNTIVDSKLEELKKDPLKITEYWNAAQSRINLANQIMFFKTHNACVAYKGKWFADETNTKGYIYIVRDPRSVACSKAYHSDLSMEKSVDSLINKNEIGYNGPHKLVEIPGSWKMNYLSWKKKKKFNGVINIGERRRSDFENYKKFNSNIKPCKRKDIIKDLNFEIAKDASMNLNIFKKLKS